MTSSKSQAYELIPDTEFDTLGPDSELDPAPQVDVAAAEPGFATAHAERRLAPSVLRVEDYFNGRLWADGVLFDRRGRVRRRFHVDMRGQWTGDRGLLHESFLFDDGERQQRTWNLHRLPEQDGVRCYEATAGDVVGTARGRASGDELRWNYVLAIPLGRHVVHVSMDDRMYLLGEKLLINRTEMRKFGLRGGSLFITFGKA